MKANKETRIMDMRGRMSDILIEISWREIARQYFDKSSSWLYHKMNGLDGGFSEQEAVKLRESLLDLSDRIRKSAESIVFED